MHRPDSLIFDMDGTLWDAGDTYTAAWNHGLKVKNIDRTMHREELDRIMGWEKKQTLAHLLPDHTEEEREAIHEEVHKVLNGMILTMGGIMYEGVKDGLARLSKKYKLFILSNCPAYTIQYFMKWAGIGQYITDELAHGVNFKPKSHNIKLLIEKHKLKNPVYIGDTEGDQKQAELAGVPFVFVSYGFGKVDKYDLKFESFGALVKHFE